MKKMMKNTGWLIAIALVTFSCSDKSDTRPTQEQSANEQSHGGFSLDNLRQQLANLPVEDLSVEEEEGIVLMREEELLAHLVYAKLYEQWNRQIFNNISASEWTHTNAVSLLLDKYELPDPLVGQEEGTFQNELLQQLYDELLSRGEQGLAEALMVGAKVEEIDILDLTIQLDTVVDNADITLVYNNLLKGSRNHLRAFVKNLQQVGVTYVPVHLTTEAYQAIINSPMETGG